MIQIIIDNLVFTGICSSVIAVLLGLLSRMSKKRFSGKVLLTGWMIAMAALILPLYVMQTAVHFQMPLVSGAFGKFSASVMQQLDIRFADVVQNVFPALKTIPDTGLFAMTIRDILFFVWLLGVILLTTLRMRVYIPFHRNMLKGSKPCENNWTDFVPVWLRSKISLREADITSPIVFGVFRNIVIIPKNVTNESTLRYALTHEFIHIRRNDLLIKLIAEIAAMIQWFNPFAWIIRNSINNLCEVSCDEEVAADLSPEKRKEYASAILDFIDQSFEPAPSVPPLILSFFGKEVSLKERLENIVQYEKMSRRMFYISSVLLLLFTILGFVTASALVSEKNDTLKAPLSYAGVIDSNSVPTQIPDTTEIFTVIASDPVMTAAPVATQTPVITTEDTLPSAPTCLPISYTVTIDGLQMTFPMAYDDFIALGWSSAIVCDLEPERFALLDFSRNGHNTRFVMTNYGYETVPISKGYVVGFEMNKNPSYTFTIAGNIQFGSTREQVQAAFGDPYVNYGNNFVFTDDGTAGTLYCSSIQFSYDQEDKVNRIYMQCVDGLNDIAPPVDVLDKEAPEIVQQYERPTDLGTELSDRIIRIDGNRYKFPCPLKAFLDNGWEITEGADRIIKASGVDNGVCIEKDGYTLNVPLRNYTDEAQPVRNCFIIEMYFDKLWNDVPLKFTGGITNQSTLKEVLEAYGEPSEIVFDEVIAHYKYIYGTRQSNVSFDFYSEDPEEIICNISFQYYYSQPY